jgi:hypothetical protein
MTAVMSKLTLAFLVGTLGFVVAGCHVAPCGGCADWETCEAATNTCALNAGTKFDLVAVDGEVPGDNWDPFFGAPDPFVCASVGAAESCTQDDSDDHSPSWNQELLADLGGDELLSTTIAVRYEDSDVDSPDPICSGTVVVSAAELHAGGFDYRCTNGAWVHFALRNTVRGTPTVVGR